MSDPNNHRETERNIHIKPHYENYKLEDIEQLREVFGDIGVTEDNWCFVGTSGVHGSYAKLDKWPEQETFTVLVVRPRLVSCLYGEITLQSEDDYHYLRGLVEKTVETIQQTQPEYDYHD